MRSLKKIIACHFPFHYHGRNLLTFSFTILLLTFLFQFLFEPFNVERGEHQLKYLYICIIQSLVASTIILCTVGLVGLFINKSKWNIAKEVLLIISILITIGVTLFLLRDIFYNNPDNWSIQYLLEEIRNSFFVGLLIFVIYYPLRLLLSQRAGQLHNNDTDYSRIWINSVVKSESFFINPENFVFAKSDGNYIEIFLLRDCAITKVIKRITIKDFALQLNSLSYIMRVHRSYVINLKHPHYVQRGGNGTFVIFESISEKIPVSRSMAREFNKRSQ